MFHSTTQAAQCPMLENDIAQESTIGISSFVDLVEENRNPGVLLDEELVFRGENLSNNEDRKLAIFYKNAGVLGIRSMNCMR